MNIWWRERADKKYKRIVYYGFGDKKYIVEGWKGKYNLKGNPKVLSFICNGGLASKNSQRFSIIE
ncbi:MAG TPA: CRISPR-associated endoribonuclease Cas6 [Fervidobacterium sp.]|nr:CRISPR-associated endoribonuclease Cas6 [Fervidobacterium sp.]